MEHQELIAVMNDLKQSRGWNVILDHVKPLLQKLELDLLGNEDILPDQQKLMKIKWNLYKKFSEYPDFIVAKSAAGLNPGEHNADPYE